MKQYTTDAVNTFKFRPHGRIEWTVLEEGIVFYKAHGPFNKELFEALIELESEDFTRMSQKQQKWVEVVLFIDSCFAMPEVKDLYGPFLQSAVNRGIAPTASAFVFTKDLEGAAFSKKIYRELYENAGIGYEEFSEAEPALIWARAKLNILNKM